MGIVKKASGHRESALVTGGAGFLQIENIILIIAKIFSTLLVK